MSDTAADAGDDARSDSDDPLVEVVHAVGHENVTAGHASTVELTTDDWLTPAGDCIIGIEANRTPDDFAPEFREACQNASATIEATFVVDGDDETHREAIAGRGDPDLTLLDDRSMVGRTSDYTDDERTIFVKGEGAAADLDRDLAAALADGADLTLRLEVTPAE